MSYLFFFSFKFFENVFAIDIFVNTFINTVFKLLL